MYTSEKSESYNTIERGGLYDEIFTRRIYRHGNYLLDMELPGYKKEDIHLDLKDGYLNITAAKNSSNEEKDDKGNIIRQERYSGSCARSFYVGNAIREEDIRASFDNGELKITFPKEESRKVEEKRFIPIE